jgi:hypothetical protein
MQVGGRALATTTWKTYLTNYPSIDSGGVACVVQLWRSSTSSSPLPLLCSDWAPAKLIFECVNPRPIERTPTRFLSSKGHEGKHTLFHKHTLPTITLSPHLINMALTRDRRFAFCAVALVALITSGVCAESEMKNRDGSPVQQPTTDLGSTAIDATLLPIAATLSADPVFSTLVAAVGAVGAGGTAGGAALVADLASDGPWTVGASSTHIFCNFETVLSCLLFLPPMPKHCLTVVPPLNCLRVRTRLIACTPAPTPRCLLPPTTRSPPS